MRRDFSKNRVLTRSEDLERKAKLESLRDGHCTVGIQRQQIYTMPFYLLQTRKNQFKFRIPFLQLASIHGGS